MRRVLLAAAAALLLLAGCSGGDDDSATQKPTFEAPAGIELDDPGTEAKVGATLTVAYPDTSETGTALALGVTSIEKAGRRDFALYSTPDGLQAYYVHVMIGNRGPNAAAFADGVPWWLHVSGDVLVPASPAPAGFTKCTAPKVAASMDAGASVEGCLLFFAPKGSTVSSVDFQPGDVTTAVRWTP